MTQEGDRGKSQFREQELDIAFTADDVDILSTVLEIAPELKICAVALQRARQACLEYPLKSPDELVRLLPEKRILAEGHRITVALVKAYVTSEEFPLEDETALVRAVYAALLRCNAAFQWAAQAPNNADEVLAEYRRLLEGPGECDE